MNTSSTLFDMKFLVELRSLIALHNTLYPRTPPQGIFFESLVEQAFTRSGWPADQTVLNTANIRGHDLQVGGATVSLKTETGAGTRLHVLNITKLCTTEREPWNSATLIAHAMAHLGMYDRLLMLRAIREQRAIHYQLLEIPLDLLRLIATVTVLPVGQRAGRRSMAADVFDRGENVFRVHFDGADGKCQIRRLLVSRCQILLEWDQPAER
ncbi:MAG: hypothetical protein HY784_18285 [Chloroflexi bacterium]|nr:hypothetical protein [Chloroflexota bacterium]